VDVRVAVRVKVDGTAGDGDWDRIAVGVWEGAAVAVGPGVALGGGVPTGQNEPGRMVAGRSPKVSG
jgi:hypothetical protein